MPQHISKTKFVEKGVVPFWSASASTALRSLIGWSFFVLLWSNSLLHSFILILQDYHSVEVLSDLLYLVDFGGAFFLESFQSRSVTKVFFPTLFVCFSVKILVNHLFKYILIIHISQRVFLSSYPVKGSSHRNWPKWHKRESSLMGLIYLIFLFQISIAW